MRATHRHTERGKRVPYFINLEIVKLYERWNFTGRLGRVVLNALLYREGFEKPTSYISRIRNGGISYGGTMNIPRALSSLERAPYPSKDKRLNTVTWRKYLPTLYSNRMPSRTYTCIFSSSS